MERLTNGKRIAIGAALLISAVLGSGVRTPSDGADAGQPDPAPSFSEPSSPVDSDFLAEAQAHLAAREYWASATGAGLQAPNRRHDLRSYFEPTGVRVHDRTEEGNGPFLGLQLVGLGRGADLSPVAEGEVTHHEGRVEIARRELGLIEWFENSDQGLEQGFTLARRPVGSTTTAATPAASPNAAIPAPTTGPNPGNLVVELSVSGSKASLRGEEVVLNTDAGRKLSYGKLAVVDAGGQTLAAHFEVPGPDRIRVVVDDQNASYPIVIDPLLQRLADRAVESNQTDAFLGGSVASAGDVNGDGYDDVIVGARFYDAGQLNEGAAFLFLGPVDGSGIQNPSTSDAQFESDQQNALLGSSVASAGDVNGDGYSDIVIGAPNYGSGGQFGEGAAFLYLGSASGIAPGRTPATADAQLESDQNSANLGISVASAGDVNGDGYSDVIVGAHQYTAGQDSEGAAFVFLGSAAGIADGNPTTAHAQLESNQLTGLLGNSVASAGDVNGDGYDDVIVGAYFYSAGQNREGAAFVFLGSASGIADGNPVTAHAQLESNLANSEFGYSVASAGDVNGDGYADVVAGARLYSNGQGQEGGAFVFLGSASGLVDGTPATAHQRLEPNSVGAQGGSGLGAGDINGDGYGDVVVGAQGYSNGQANEGAAFVYLGSATGLSATPQLQIESNQPSASYGSGVGLGDINGDGFSDVFVGAEIYDIGQANEGAVFLYHGAASGVANGNAATAHARIETQTVNPFLSVRAASAGDVNGDGFSDVIIGVPNFDFGSNAYGAAFVFLGSAAGIASGDLGTADAVLRSDQAQSSMGYSVSSAGDVNGDGYGDVIVGAPSYDFPAVDEGAAFVFLGGSNGISSGDPSTAHARLESDQAEAFMGWSVATAGDVNGDGYGDLIAAASYYDSGQTDEGAAFVFLGSATGVANGNPTTAHAQLETNQAGTFGYSVLTGVASAGDLNGDGYGDVIISAAWYDSGEIDEGAAFVFLGSATGIADGNPTTAHAQLETNQAGPFGPTLSTAASAGDVNGDGYGDLVVGAAAYNAGQAYEGAAFLFLGSSTGIADGNPTTADARLESNQAGAYFGNAVASAGDVNGDGYGDVIVSALQFASSPTSSGSAFVFLGSAGGIANGTPATAHAQLDSDQPDLLLGSGVAAAGDLNGDGFADVIAGGSRVYPFIPNTYLDEVFLFLGNSEGRPVLAQQRRGDGSSTAVQPGGSAYAAESFEVEMFVTSPWGRELAKLEIEVCPNATAFGSGTCTTRISSGWVDLETSGALLSETITGLTANRLFSWRARALYAPYASTQPGITPIERAGPWFRIQGRSAPGDVRTVPEPGLVAGVIAGIVALVGAHRKVIRG